MTSRLCGSRKQKRRERNDQMDAQAQPVLTPQRPCDTNFDAAVTDGALGRESVSGAGLVVLIGIRSIDDFVKDVGRSLLSGRCRLHISARQDRWSVPNARL